MEASTAARLKGALRDKMKRAVLVAGFALILNVLYAAYNAYLGIQTASAWPYTIFVCYLIFALLRYGAIRLFFAMRDSDESRTAREVRTALRRSGIIILLLIFVLSGTVVLSIQQNHEVKYDHHVAVLLAAYTFYKLFFGLVSMVIAQRAGSHVLIIIRNIGFADAVMSIIPLQIVMLGTYMDSSSTLDVHGMTVMTGTGICLVLLALGSSMLWMSRKSSKSALD